MPLLDVTLDVLFDPDFASRFIVVRRQKTVNQFGEDVQSEERTSVVGVLTNSGGGSVVREGELMRMAKQLTVHARFRFIGVNSARSGNVYGPDLVLWNGDYYVVDTVDDWSPFGSGFTTARLNNFDYTTRAPSGSEQVR